MSCTNCEVLKPDGIILTDTQGCCVGCGRQIEPRPEPYQPSGLKGFGWGLLGFFGANFIINLSTRLFMVASEEMALLGFLLGMLLAYQFAKLRNYQSTRTGALVAMWIQGIAFMAAFLVLCSNPGAY